MKLQSGTKNYQTVASGIRNTAVRKLIENHKEEYKKYYSEAAKAAGIYKYSKERVEVLESKLAELQEEIKKQKDLVK